MSHSVSRPLGGRFVRQRRRRRPAFLRPAFFLPAFFLRFAIR